jgi:histone acetyltransferase 1
VLKKLEGIAKWFIETADGIDFSDDRWECLFLTRRRSRSEQACLSLCGYFTLLTFRNPFVGAKLRICQALVFPHLQGKGLGQKLFGAVYDLAQKRRDVVEVTVEDPAPAFQSLRDRVDFARAIEAEKISVTCDGDAGKNEAEPIQKLQRELKITKGQATFILEAKAYANLNKTKSGKGGDDGLSSFKSFRLGVKRRLCKEKPALMKLTKEERQEALEELFDEQEARFKAVEKLYRS